MNLMKLVAVAALAVGLSSVAVAQQVAKGQTEVLGFLGGITDGGGATLGGGLQYGVQRRWLLSGELGWASGGKNSSLFTVDANVHYLIPLKSNPKFTPYLLGGLGIIHGTNGGDTDAGLNLGGGARWEVGRDWGLRPEIKFLVADNTSARFTIGIYKSFGRR
jgi:outer membrane protein X